MSLTYSAIGRWCPARGLNGRSSPVEQRHHAWSEYLKLDNCCAEKSACLQMGSFSAATPTRKTPLFMGVSFIGFLHNAPGYTVQSRTWFEGRWHAEQPGSAIIRNPYRTSCLHDRSQINLMPRASTLDAMQNPKAAAG
jgi:hypothetical protein